MHFPIASGEFRANLSSFHADCDADSTGPNRSDTAWMLQELVAIVDQQDIKRSKTPLADMPRTSPRISCD